MNIELANSTALATARWADPDYIFDRYPFEPGTIWLGRNPHGFDQAVGYGDDRHVLVCAGSGAGKGRSFIINNASVWPGSIVAYDPKGDIPDILAARRGPGDEFCEGMEQEVFVLDPLGRTNLGPEYLAYFDPLSGLDPDDGELPTKAKRIARSVVEQAQGGNSEDWRKRAIRLIALIICHVVTERHPDFDQPRNLMTVLSLLLEGDTKTHSNVLAGIEQRIAEAVEEGDEEKAEFWKNKQIPDPTEMLFEAMRFNEGCRGWISRDANSLMRTAKETPKYFESVRGEATDQLDWFKSEGIEIALTGQCNGRIHLPPERQLDAHRLKNDPKGIAVFIVMPVDDLETYLPWVQCVFQGIFAAHRKDKTAPESGHQTLCIIDEFLSLGHQDYVANALDNIRSAGMKLMIVVQNFGTLFARYKDQIESFQTNVGLEVFFGKIGDRAGDYLTKNLGETLIVTHARSVNASQAQAHQESLTKTIGKSTSVTDSESLGETINETETRGTTTNVTDTHGTSDTENWNQGESKTRGVNWSDSTGWSRGENISDSRNWGQSEGNSMGRNYGPGLFEAFANSKNFGTNSSHNSGGSRSRGSSWGKNGSSTRGGQRSHTKNWSTGGSRGTTQSQSVSEGASQSFARARGESRTLGKSWQSGENEATAEQSGDTETYTIGFGVAENFQKRPLLTFDEMNRCFGSYTREDRDHPAYPGLILCRIDRENPFFLRRCNYDEDPYFEGCFSASPEHGFTPLAKIPTHGYQYTEDHLLHIQLPPKLIEYDFKSEALVRRFEWVERGDPLFEVAVPENGGTLVGKVPIRARVVDVRGASDETTPLLTLKMDRPMTDDELLGYTKTLFGPSLLKIESEEARLRRIREAEEARLRQIREAEEAERLRKEAAQRKREEEEAAARRRHEEEARKKRKEAEEQRQRKEAEALNAWQKLASEVNRNVKSNLEAILPPLILVGFSIITILVAPESPMGTIAGTGAFAGMVWGLFAQGISEKSRDKYVARIRSMESKYGPKPTSVSITDKVYK